MDTLRSKRYLQSLEYKVEQVLKVYPEARNSDQTLTIILWRQYYPQYLTLYNQEYYTKLENLYKLPSQDNIKRLRARIQNTRGEYLPTTWAVAKVRQISEETWNEYTRKVNLNQMF